MRIGSKRALQIMLGGMILALLVVVGTAPDRIFFIPLDSAPLAWDGPVFRHVTDIVFLALLLVMTGLTSGTTASSRALLASLSRSEGRRVGKERVCTVRYWGSAYC